MADVLDKVLLELRLLLLNIGKRVLIDVPGRCAVFEYSEELRLKTGQ